MLYDSSTPREVTSLVYEAQSFPFLKNDGTEVDVYWSFLPVDRLDRTPTSEVTDVYSNSKFEENRSSMD